MCGRSPIRLALIRRRPSAILVVAVLVLSGLPVVASASNHALGGSAGTVAAREGTKPDTSLLAAAEDSLANGSGPAEGTGMSCTPSGGGYDCSSVLGPTNGNGSAIPATSLAPLPAASPSARFGAAMTEIHNGSREGFVLFGGANSTGYVFGDTWQFDVGTRTWWNVTPLLLCGTTGNCPPPRHDPAAAYNSSPSANYMLMFGGCRVVPPGWIHSTPGCDTSGSHFLGDTWIYTGNSSLTGGIGTWSSVTPAGPSPRYAAGLAYDGQDNYMILFGGCGVSTCPLSDTWDWAPTGWHSTSFAGPTGRYGAAFANGTIFVTPPLPDEFPILFGGCATVRPGCPGLALLQDTWVFKGGTGWSQLIASSSCSPSTPCPPARYYPSAGWYQTAAGSGLQVFGGIGAGGVVYGPLTDPGGSWWSFTRGSWAEGTGAGGYTASMCNAVPLGPASRYDAAYAAVLSGDGTLLFGGSSSTGSSLGDSWGCSLATGNGLLVPQSLSPPPQFGASQVYFYDTANPSNHYDLLVGGCANVCGSAATWSYSPAVEKWALQTSPGLTPGRAHASLVFDKASHQAFLFGGITSAGLLLSDTWTYSAGTGWTLVTINTQSPAAREDASWAEDPGAGYMVLFGGLNASGPASDTWEFTYSLGSNIGSWHPVSGIHPTARYGASMAWDSRGSFLLLFGGCGSTCPLGDTWFFASGVWRSCIQPYCVTGPAARWGATMVDDISDGYLLLFGGCGATCPLGDTEKWVDNGLLNTGWFGVSPPTSPPARYDASMSYDMGGSAVLLFGGIGHSGQVFGDYGWSYSGGTWYPAGVINQLPHSPAPAPRFGASLAFSSSTGFALLFGGCELAFPGTSASGPCGPLSTSADTWEFVNGRWSWICCGGGPTARWDASLVYDSLDGYFLLFGGCPATSTTCTTSGVLGDTWKFVGNTWTSLGSSGPPSRADASMTFDAGAGANFVLLFGGLGCGGSCGDTWRFSGSWLQLTPSSHPTARYGAAMSYDPAQGVVVLYGGVDSTGPKGDTWTFSSNNWMTVSGAGGTARFDASLTFDWTDGTLVLFGGADQTTVKSDTYTFTGTSWAPLSTLSTPTARAGMAASWISAGGANGFLLLFGGVLLSDYEGVSQLGSVSPGQGDSWDFLLAPGPSGSAAWIEVSGVV